MLAVTVYEAFHMTVHHLLPGPSDVSARYPLFLTAKGGEVSVITFARSAGK